LQSFYSKSPLTDAVTSAASTTSTASTTSQTVPTNDVETDAEQKRHVALFRLYLIFQDMKVHGYTPDAAVYNTLINACANAGDLEKALETVAAMQSEGISPNVITYTSLLKACGINGGENAVVLAEEIFSAMQQRTNHFSTYIEPTMLTFQRLIQVHLRNGATLEDTTRVWELWREVINRGLHPGMTICRSCVRAAKIEGDVERALSFIDYIRRNTALKYDFKSWSMASQLCMAMGRMDEERLLRKEMGDKKSEFQY
jgi:pentatricopeptide repeat protein